MKTAEGISQKWVGWEFGGLHLPKRKELESEIEEYASQFKIHLSPDRILTQEEFNKQYEHYQELLNRDDVAGFYADQFAMANAERNKLKEYPPVIAEPTEEDIDQASKDYVREFAAGIPFGQDETVKEDFKAGIKWYKAKTGRS